MSAVVAQSLPEFCVVCDGTGHVQLTWLMDTGRTVPIRVVPCPHCNSAYPIPVLISKGVK